MEMNGIEAVQVADVTTNHVEETKPNDDFSQRIAYLAKKEKAIQEQRESWETEKKTMQQRLQEAETYKQLVERMKQKDYGALKEVGFDYNDYTQSLLSNGNPTPQQLMEKAMREMDEKLEQKLKSREDEYSKRAREQAEQAEQMRIKEFKSMMKDELAEIFKAEDHPYQFLQTQDDPVELIYEIKKKHYDTTLEKDGRGKVLSTKEASEIAEKYFEDYLDKNVFSKPKARQLWEAKLNAKPQDPLKVEQKSVPSMQTLTNNVSNAPQTAKKGPMDRQKSLEEAAKLLRFT